MDQIQLQDLLPLVFRNRENIRSEIWLQTRTFRKGEKYLLEAASGTGKSSLCSYIFGYRNDYSGNLFFDRQDTRKVSRNEWNRLRRTSLSILFQELRLFPELTAWENVLLKNHLTGFKTTDWIKTAFTRLELEEKISVPCGQLSFGQQQRVALIRSLCQPFDFILLDEPVSHLDQASGQLTTDLLLEETRQQGSGLIVTSIGKHPEIAYDQTLRL